jgi:hypothetical protein
MEKQGGGSLLGDKAGTFVRSVLGKEQSRVIRNVSLFISVARF